MSLLERYRALIRDGTLKPDAAQKAAAERLDALARALKADTGRRWFSLFAAKTPRPRGLYLWGDVGRGKSMLMDLFFAEAPVARKRRVHFNAFMVETHERIHAARARGEADPIPPVARQITDEAGLLCFDEFQVSDVADAMILGRLFAQLFENRVVVVATSNTPPAKLYEGGLNRQLFLPFIALLKEQLDIITINSTVDYRQNRLGGMAVYLTPLGAAADAGMESAWRRLTHGGHASPVALPVLGRTLTVPRAASGVARFSFDELCARPLAAADYLVLAHHFHTVLIEHIPAMTPEMRNEAKRFMLLIDTLYDEGVMVLCSAAAEPEALYPTGDGMQAFRRTASRLAEMQSADYLDRAMAERQAAGVD
ncbi:MAG: AFG1 family ATPase [Alphaproteobacteria bacterium]|nr:AFG1 family ATPase [Alphaproteobacteria bacterium]